LSSAPVTICQAADELRVRLAQVRCEGDLLDLPTTDGGVDVIRNR
jgi:hypothetical protein